MHTYDTLYEAFCKEKIRKYTVYVDFYKKTESGWEYTTTISSGTSDVVWGSSVISLKIVKGLTSGSFDVGKCLNSELTLTLYTGIFRLEQGQNWKIVVQVSFTGVWAFDQNHEVRESGKAELGTFYSESETVNEFTHTIKATSAVSKMEKYYVPVESEYPKAAQDVMSEICTEIGVSSEYVGSILTVTRPDLSEPPYKSVNEETGEKEYYTMREIVGYFAAVQGGSAYIDSKNCLRVTTPTATSTEIPQDSMISIKDNNRTSRFSFVYIPQEYEAGTPEAIAVAEKVDPKSKNYNENILVVDFPLKTQTEYSTMRSRLESAISGMSFESCVIKKQGTGKYELGDFLECRNPRTKAYYGNVMVMGIVYEISANNGFTETLYSLSKAKSDGTSLSEKVDKAEKKAEESGKKSSGGAIESYVIEAENKVTANGISYTVEKDASGIINKISDSLGNLLIPTVNITVTDKQLHNAVMWATAVARGITGEAPGEFMPYMDGIYCFFTPNTFDTLTGHWLGNVEAYNREPFFAPSTCQAISSNGKAWHCTAFAESDIENFNKSQLDFRENYGNITISTVYSLAKVSNLNTADIGEPPIGFAPVLTQNNYTYGNTGGSAWGFTNTGQLIFRRVPNWYDSGISYKQYEIIGENGQYLDKYVCVAWTIVEDPVNVTYAEGTIFIDGIKQGKVIQTQHNQANRPYITLNSMGSGYGDNYVVKSYADCDFKFLALADTVHTDQQIAENCQWIMKKYQLDWKE